MDKLCHIYMHADSFRAFVRGVIESSNDPIQCILINSEPAHSRGRRPPIVESGLCMCVSETKESQM